MLEKKCVGVVAQSVEPLDPPKKQGAVCVGSSPTDSNKKVPFLWVLVLIIMQTSPPLRFHTPSSILVVGPSGCGKTVFTEKLLVDNPDLFETPPTQMHYCYGAWQDRFRGMQDRGVVFHKGIPDHQALVQWFPQGRGPRLG